MNLTHFFSASFERGKKPSNDTQWMSLEQARIAESFNRVAKRIHLTQEFLENHQRKKPLEKRPLVNHLNMISLMFSDFAKNQEYFSALSAQDQEVLIKHNSPLYIQYILARYFSSETGREQIAWISQGNGPPSESTYDLCRISFEEFNCSTNLFQCSESADHFDQLCGNVGCFYPLTPQCTALLANLLLFHTDELINKSLVAPSLISELFEKATWLLKLGLESGTATTKAMAEESELVSNFGPLIRTLTKMKSIFEKSKCFY